MSVTFILPDELKGVADGKNKIDVEGKTFGECVDAVIACYPALKEEILDGDGRILLKWMIQVNGAMVTFENERRIAVSDGDSVALVSLLA